MKLKYTIPQKWNDLSSYQLLRIGKLLSKQDQISKRRFISALISILLMPKFSIKHFIKAIVLFSQVPLSELEKYCLFITEKTDVLTKFPDKFKIKGHLVYGPSLRLANLTIEEFSYADGYFYNWATKKDSLDLDRLVSCLYRRSGIGSTEADMRMPFNKLTLAKQAEFAQKIPTGYKIIIALAYQGSREKIYARYPIVFPKPKKNSTAETKKNIYQPFTKVIQAMAMDEKQVLGTLQETEKVDISTFFSVFEVQIIRHRELEKMK